MINKEELVETLTKGRNSAKKLQNLLRQEVNDDGLVSVDELVSEISQSFYGGLLVLNSCNSGELSRVPVSARPNSACSGDQTPEVFTGDTGKTPAPAVKGRRGCYKRRKTIDSRVEVSSTIEDGYAWRKYGQKKILNSKSPRCYFRCTHKQAYGCKTVKQVQKLEDGSNKFHIIYFGQHTCRPPNTGLDLDCNHSEKNHNLPNSPSTITKNHTDPSLKQEDLSNKVSSASGESSSALAWKEMFLDDFECCENDGSLSDSWFDDSIFP
ncbi:hypothetical protein L1987_35337 [Smallanthus sonchifolius]|uniref:Uncharacterized protein n=1 Tax=Smallanthus sonchifolius TaxID=185202 RepID=A0ACB9HY28_9ASTR|nr:hypothetical protein L1987_35337 [Smallanthus sonchifolius]